MKVQETGNLSYLIRSQSVHIEKKKVGKWREAGLKIVWRQLMDEYIARFGFSDSLLQINRKEKQLARLIVQRCQGDKTVNALIKIAELELIELKKTNNKGGDFWQNKAAIEKGMGFTINVMTCSVAEFHSYIKLLEKQAKRKSNG